MLVDGSVVELVGIHEVFTGPVSTYNLHVEDCSNYFADGVLVHNKSTRDGGGGTPWQPPGEGPTDPEEGPEGWDDPPEDDEVIFETPDGL